MQRNDGKMLTNSEPTKINYQDFVETDKCFYDNLTNFCFYEKLHNKIQGTGFDTKAKPCKIKRLKPCRDAPSKQTEAISALLQWASSKGRIESMREVDLKKVKVKPSSVNYV